MPGTNYLPNREAELVTWVNNFSAKITTDPIAVGLTALQATGFATLKTSFISAYTTANDPMTNSEANTTAKNIAKEALIRGPGGVRQLVGIIQKFPGTTDTQRVDLGITVPDVAPSPVPPPAFAPEIDVFPPVVRTVKIRMHNEKSIGRKGKPDGAIGATIFSFVGPLPPPLDQIAMWKFEQQTGKTTAEIEFPSTVEAGATVWITAYWYNLRGEASPATPPVNVNLPGTLQQEAA